MQRNYNGAEDSGTLSQGSLEPERIDRQYRNVA